ncbi:MAG TPA: hypothetical protein DCY40_04365 [Actinobacteria bacterium]|nr:hypothetical protein [Actinomycetota bacterium]
MTEFILRLRNEADTADFSALADPAIFGATRRPSFLGRLRTRAAAAVAATVMCVGGLGGVAYAANGATPGDFLYGLDRALESVGIGNGGASERITEAIVLAQRGSPGHGLEHAAAVVPDDTGAGSALLAAAEGMDPAVSTEVQDEVMALLTYLSDNVGNIDGQTVADFAHAIGGRGRAPIETPPGPPDGVPGGPPVSTPVGPPVSTPVGPPVSTPVGPPVSTPVGPPTTTTTTLP